MRHVAWVFVGSLLLWESTATAQSMTPRARDELARSHFRAGVRAFDERHFADAALEFERVVEYSNQNELYLNVARAWELADEPGRALRAWQRFLDAGARGMERATVQASIERLRPLAEARERENCQPNATAATRPAPVNVPPVSATPSPAATATSSGALLQLRTREVYEHSTVNIAGPFVLLGVGAVFAGFSAWQVGSLLGHNAQVDEATRSMNPERWTVERSAAYLAIPREQMGAATLGAAAGTALVGGVLWFALRGPGERREQVLRSRVNVLPVFYANETQFSVQVGGAL